MSTSMFDPVIVEEEPDERVHMLAKGVNPPPSVSVFEGRKFLRIDRGIPYPPGVVVPKNHPARRIPRGYRYVEVPRATIWPVAFLKPGESYAMPGHLTQSIGSYRKKLGLKLLTSVDPLSWELNLGAKGAQRICRTWCAHEDIEVGRGARSEQMAAFYSAQTTVNPQPSNNGPEPESTPEEVVIGDLERPQLESYIQRDGLRHMGIGETRPCKQAVFLKQAKIEKMLGKKFTFERDPSTNRDYIITRVE